MCVCGPLPLSHRPCIILFPVSLSPSVFVKLRSRKGDNDSQRPRANGYQSLTVGFVKANGGNDHPRKTLVPDTLLISRDHNASLYEGSSKLPWMSTSVFAPMMTVT